MILRVAKDSGVVSKRDWSFSDGIGGDVMKIVREVNVESKFKGDKQKKRVQKGLKKGKGEVQSGTRTRTSPRLTKRGSSSR